MIQNNFRKLGSLLDFFYPSFCRSCNQIIPSGKIFCLKCFNDIKPIVSSFLKVNQKTTIKIFAASAYKDPLKKMILQKNYSSNCLFSKQLGEIIYQKTCIKNLSFDFIIPVPLHWSRYAFRGYNQALIISKVLSKKLNCPVLDILQRKKRTLFQSTLSFEKRKLNVKDAFKVKKRFFKKLDLSKITNKKILLVDDLYTTGSTLKSISKTLIKFNPKSISAVVTCRVI